MYTNIPLGVEYDGDLEFDRPRSFKAGSSESHWHKAVTQVIVELQEKIDVKVEEGKKFLREHEGHTHAVAGVNKDYIQVPV